MEIWLRESRRNCGEAFFLRGCKSREIDKNIERLWCEKLLTLASNSLVQLTHESDYPRPILHVQLEKSIKV